MGPASSNTGTSTGPDTRGPAAALRAAILIRKAPTRHGRCCASSSSITSRRASLAPARRWAARLARHQKRQGKADSAGNQKRAERVILHLPCKCLRAVAEGVAAVVVGILGIVHRRVARVARGVLGLAVQVLCRACGFAGAA